MLLRLSGPLLVTLAALTLFLEFCPWSRAQGPYDPSKHDVATTWKGVHFQITELKKLPGNRLLVIVCVYGQPGAPFAGTLIGTPVPIPPGTTPEMIATGYYSPKPFTIDSATMKDELTQQVYTTVKPAPAGTRYVPSTLLAVLHPKQSQFMSIQFPYPPPLPSPPGSPPPQPTVSILLPQAIGPIGGLALPSSVSP